MVYNNKHSLNEKVHSFFFYCCLVYWETTMSRYRKITRDLAGVHPLCLARRCRLKQEHERGKKIGTLFVWLISYDIKYYWLICCIADSAHKFIYSFHCPHSLPPNEFFLLTLTSQDAAHSISPWHTANCHTFANQNKGSSWFHITSTYHHRVRFCLDLKSF